MLSRDDGIGQGQEGEVRIIAGAIPHVVWHALDGGRQRGERVGARAPRRRRQQRTSGAADERGKLGTKRCGNLGRKAERRTFTAE